MFQSALLRGALVALAVIDNLVEADALNPDDLTNYPIIAEAMAHGNDNFDWVAHPVVTSSGYQIVMFHIKSKVPAEANKGPLLLIHGMFSTPEEFLEITDEDKPSWPM